MNKLTTTRLIILSLVFSILYSSCRSDKNEELSIIWENNKAVKLVIPKSLLGGANESKVQVHVNVNSNPGIIGEYKVETGNVVFQPAIPFTRGLTYKVFAGQKEISSITIPTIPSSEAAKIVAVYPSGGLIPENLLKIYIQFSKPMKEGESLEHIFLVKGRKDTLHNVFLDLQPELWNNDRTILTVWFDPGRIKRDLQPNLAMGSPLTKGNQYTLLIKQDWKDVDGSELQENFLRNFVTDERDSLSPGGPSNWSIIVPPPGGTDKLEIDFFEPLDYMLARNAVHILDKDEKEVPGTITLHPAEDGLHFVPAKPWQTGKYTIMVESRLEDLAGNNLDHPFDNDITQKQNKNQGKNYRKEIKIE